MKKCSQCSTLGEDEDSYCSQCGLELQDEKNHGSKKEQVEKIPPGEEKTIPPQFRSLIILGIVAIVLLAFGLGGYYFFHEVKNIPTILNIS